MEHIEKKARKRDRCFGLSEKAVLVDIIFESKKTDAEKR
jgi:hypothetical protein